MLLFFLALLPLLPVKSYLLPGVALFVLMLMLPILLIYVSVQSSLGWILSLAGLVCIGHECVRLFRVLDSFLGF